MPDEIKVSRLILFSSLLFHSLASYALFQKTMKHNPLGGKLFFISNLIDGLEALFVAEISPETKQQLL